MFSKFFGKKKEAQKPKPIVALKKSWWVKTKELLSGSALDQDMQRQCEELLIRADCGMSLTKKVIHELARRVESDHSARPSDVLADILSEYLLAMNESDVNQGEPTLILMVGVNGVGKTTTMAKLTKRYQSQGKKMMMAAGDTFRAAAIEQLQVWGQRLDCPVIAQQPGSDTAAVIYDALMSAKAKKADILLADTAGRMHGN